MSNVRSRPRKQTAAAAASRRSRARILRELWAGRVKTCEGRGKCLWAEPDHECLCPEPQDGELYPCTCERSYFEEIMKDTSARVGGAIGSVLASAVLDLAREVRRGNEADVRSDRIKLLGLLLSDDRGRQDLSQRERRLVLAEGRKLTNAQIITQAVESASQANLGPPGGTS